jgi:hypothetical protein
VEAYFVDEGDVNRAADEPAPDALLEAPMTIGTPRPRWVGRLIEWGSRRHFWLRPNGRNGAAMRARVDEALAEGRGHLMFMLHSSELMAGGSPTFPDAASVARLDADVAALFAHAAAGGCAGRTLGEFAAQRRAAAKAN